MGVFLDRSENPEEAITPGGLGTSTAKSNKSQRGDKTKEKWIGAKSSKV